MQTKQKVPMRYIPKYLTRKDKKTQSKMLKKSRKQYKQGKYFTRKNVASFQSKKSNHILNAERIYKVKSVSPNSELAKKTGCSIAALKKVVSKGEGAYFSSGSRPNQSAQSWGLARLASTITGGKASAVDYNILAEGCQPGSKALSLAKKSPYYKKGSRKVKKTGL